MFYQLNSNHIYKNEFWHKACFSLLVLLVKNSNCDTSHIPNSQLKIQIIAEHTQPQRVGTAANYKVLHKDVLERILNILKQDDYYRTLEDLPVIDELAAYDDIKLFPELYDTSTIIERVTAEADLIERQLRQPGMYPQHTNLSHPTSNPPKTIPNSQPTSTNNSTKSMGTTRKIRYGT